MQERQKLYQNWFEYSFLQNFRSSFNDMEPPNSDQEMQEEINNLKSEIVALQNKISQLNPSLDIDNLRDQIADLQQSLAGMRNRLDNIWNKGNNFFCLIV